MMQFEDEGTWIWVAFDPEHKVVLAHVVASANNRSPTSCSCGSRKSCCHTIVLQRWLEFYTHAILKFYGHIAPFLSTGLRCRPKCQQWFRNWSLKELLTFPYHKISV